MDTFETLVKKLKDLPVEEKDAFIREKKKQCICNTCPTYTQCSINEKETAFCLVGKSFQCISFEKGCICDDCSVYAMNVDSPIRSSVLRAMKKVSDMQLHG